MAVTVGHDAIHANVSHLPPGQAAGYTTGTPDIRWTAADSGAHPGWVRICQDTGSDHTADVLDVERYAATNADAAAWVPRARASFTSAGRPGQREPAVYTSASNVTPLVNALVAQKITSGVNLWVANWNLTDAQAVADVQNGAGPFPVVAVQFHSGQFYDTDIFSLTWLHRTSAAGPHRHVTASMTTFGQLAASRSSSMRGFTVRAFQGYTDSDWTALKDVNAGKGFIYYTQNP